jgi:hypothetical protein
LLTCDEVVKHLPLKTCQEAPLRPGRLVLLNQVPRPESARCIQLTIPSRELPNSPNPSLDGHRGRRSVIWLIQYVQSSI